MVDNTRVGSSPALSAPSLKLRNATLEALRRAEETQRDRALAFDFVGWHPSGRAASRYDCRTIDNDNGVFKLWNRVCNHAAGRHERRDKARNLVIDESLDPSVVGRLIGERPVYILGDSHSLDFFCAMSCWLLSAGESTRNTIETQFNGTWNASGPSRGKSYFIVARGGSTPQTAYQVAFHVPTCATAKGGHCGLGTHCGTLGRNVCGVGCGRDVLHGLLPSARQQPIIVFYSPCPMYHRHDLEGAYAPHRTSA